MQIQVLALIAVLTVMSGCLDHATGPRFTQIEGPEPGKAVVYLYLPDHFATALGIYVNDALITRLPSQSYYRYVTDPGVMTFSAGEGPQRQVTAHLEAGTTLFIRLGIIRWNTLLGSAFDTNLIPVADWTALRELPGLQLVLPSDTE